MVALTLAFLPGYQPRRALGDSAPFVSHVSSIALCSPLGQGTFRQELATSEYIGRLYGCRASWSETAYRPRLRFPRGSLCLYLVPSCPLIRGDRRPLGSNPGFSTHTRTESCCDVRDPERNSYRALSGACCSETPNFVLPRSQATSPPAGRVETSSLPNAPRAYGWASSLSGSRHHSKAAWLSRSLLLLT
jgi:hypothetical protein